MLEAASLLCLVVLKNNKRCWLALRNATSEKSPIVDILNISAYCRNCLTAVQLCGNCNQTDDRFKTMNHCQTDLPVAKWKSWSRAVAKGISSARNFSIGLRKSKSCWAPAGCLDSMIKPACTQLKESSTDLTQSSTAFLFFSMADLICSSCC